ncbi:hypothetical protein ZIOFF_057957 [Zingiber officinale]|uniref:Uncharacterized protein n=1 Tax=Zingiber officinale TaxID=94328 RepID=A0A8J5F7U7_ZINOF|nr:hypothetical protein ZIOFF_057957 [Zingiber officinale]
MRRSFPLLPTSGVLLLLLLFSPLLFPAKGATDAQATYIVHVAPSHKLAPSTFRHWYARTLRSLPGRPASSLLYDYSHAISGFSARLTPSQAAALRRLPSVLAIAVFTNDEISVNCSDTALASPGGLNYPAFAVVFSSNSDVITYKRVVRNVGASAEAVYEANITSPPGVAVTVSPSKLEFDAVGQSLSYEIKIESLESAAEYGAQAFGSLAWSDGTHEVRSPIAVTWKQSFVSSI